MTENSQLFVLCDTNAAARDAFLYLKKGGPELIAMLRAKQGKLLIPEVLHNEYVTQFATAGDEAIRKAERELDKIETMTGYNMKEFLPNSRFGEGQAQEILAKIEDVIHFVPLSKELKLAACDRSMEGVRPTSKSDHGLKDCMIWESLLTLPAGSEVLFVSRDAIAFFDGDTLAPELVKEAQAKGIKITAFNTAKSQSLWPLVDALKVRFADIADLVPDVVPIGDHPLIQTYARALPVAPLVTPVDMAEAPTTTPVNPGEIELELAAMTRQLLNADIKALGFVTYLKSIDKRTVVGMLERSGVATGVAHNALERLSLAELIKDTGNHYLLVGGHLADMAASQVEAELIELFEQRNA